LTKSAIDALPTPKSDTVYWDAGFPGFGVKVTPKSRKVFIVLYRTAGAGSKLRKYTVGPYGHVTLHQARVAAQKVFAAKLEGRDLAAEKRESKRRVVADRVGGSVGKLYRPISHPEPLGWGDRKAATPGSGNGLERQEHSRDQQARCG
jgi:hypothetical protein